MEKKFDANSYQKRADMNIFISGEKKQIFKPKIVIRNKEGYYILIKVPIHQEDITI